MVNAVQQVILCAERFTGFDARFQCTCVLNAWAKLLTLCNPQQIAQQQIMYVKGYC